MNPIRKRTCPVCGLTSERRADTCRQCLHIEPAANPGRWIERAACANTDPDLFFPEGNETVLGYKEARAICNGCDVAAKCLKYALDNNIRFGTWGGTSPAERGQLRRAAG